MLPYVEEVLGHKIVNRWLLLPAYERHYCTIEEAKTDFLDGKDFMIYQGPYCSIRDWQGEELYFYCGGKFQKLALEYYTR